MTSCGIALDFGSLYFLPWKQKNQMLILLLHGNKNTQTDHLAEENHERACDLLGTHPGISVAFNTVRNKSFTPSAIVNQNT